MTIYQVIEGQIKIIDFPEDFFDGLVQLNFPVFKTEQEAIIFVRAKIKSDITHHENKIVELKNSLKSYEHTSNKATTPNAKRKP